MDVRVSDIVIIDSSKGVSDNPEEEEDACIFCRRSSSSIDTSKSTSLSVNVDISFMKQNSYSPIWRAVKM